MADEEGSGRSTQGSAREPGLNELADLVSLNVAHVPAGLPLQDLTTADLRRILGIVRGGGVATCGCDAGPDGNCGCRGLDCPCNKQTGGDISLDDWLIAHERTVAELRQQLEQQHITEAQIERLRQETISGEG